MSKEDPFEEIIKRLDLDLSFPEAGPKRGSTEPDEESYRNVEPAPPRQLKHGHLLAWLGIIGSPTVITLASMVHLILPRPVLLGIGLLFVASAIYLIAQLPERGPAEPDWPDDGAQL